MRPGVFALVATSGRTAGEGLRALAARAERTCGLSQVFASQRLIVLVSQGTHHWALAGKGGVVVGNLFRRDGATVPPEDHILGSDVVRSAGASLLTTAWGGYVAFIDDADQASVHILRDPSGALACHQLERGGATLFFSEVDYALAAGLLSPRLDPTFVAQFLAYSDLRNARTGLKGVSEVMPGCRISLCPGGAEVATVWSPWSFAADSAQIGEREQATQALGETTRRCIGAWASGASSVLLELSGGLDSSIVAAGLAETPNVACVTLVTPDPGADERRYAKVMAQAIGAPLTAITLSPAAADITRAPRRMMARPGLGVLQQSVDQGLIHAATSIGPDRFLSGGGGDNVFCYLTNAAAAADALRRHGLGRTFARAVQDLATLHACSTARAAILGLRKRLRRPAPWPRTTQFLHRQAAPQRPWPHPWLPAPGGVAPGKRDHVASVMRIQNISDGKERLSLAPVYYPLLSQPLVELCLRIPSWMWISGGRNRALARDAFAVSLPPAILTRRSKGDFTAFCGSIYARNRTVLVEHILGGWLSDQGLLDRTAVEAYLADPTPARDYGFYRLLEIAAVETWARSWLARGAGG